MLSPSIYSIMMLLNNPKMSLLQAGQKNQQKELTTGFFFTLFAFGLIFHFLKKAQTHLESFYACFGFVIGRHLDGGITMNPKSVYTQHQRKSWLGKWAIGDKIK